MDKFAEEKFLMTSIFTWSPKRRRSEPERKGLMSFSLWRKEYRPGLRIRRSTVTAV
jgi:hypothetical protein